MSTTYVHAPCKVCKAPLHVGYEHSSHEAACLAIVTGMPPDLFQQVFDPAALQNYCYRIHCEDQARTHLRQNTTPEPPGKTEVSTSQPPGDVNGYSTNTNTNTPTDPHGRWTSWRERQGQTFPVPEGKVLCASCNGITHMYPNCGNCGGKGFVG